MTALEAAIRAVHFAASGLALGSFVFLLWVADGGASPRARDRLRRAAVSLVGWSVVAILYSGFAWVAVEAALMSGRPFADALDRTILTAVIGDTHFGRIMSLRLALVIALGIFIFCVRIDGRWRRIAGTALSGAPLVLLAWTGHAAAGPGAGGLAHLAADIAHLLAAGAWLGALPLLTVLLRWTADAASAHAAAQRFSSLGIACVATLVVTGLVNAWYLVGSVPALIGTDYGRLLVLKLALFAALLALAAANRLRHTPRLAMAESLPAALARLRRNAIIEIALGLAVIAVVGQLGVTMPAIHARSMSSMSDSVPGRPDCLIAICR